jgi:uracil phosphoribosyltransferase
LYEKYSENFGEMKRVFLLDPMLATGGSASMAIERILAKGIDA